MFLGKQAQSGAAILVALLAALIILYVLFLPPAERAALLGDGQPGTGPGGPSPPGVSNVVFSSPGGVIYPKVNPVAEHSLPSVHIRTTGSASVLAQRDRVSVSRNAFERNFETLSFRANPELTRNAVLSANLESISGGNVIMWVNGVEVFDQPGFSRSLPPIRLTNLEENNELHFEVTSPGFAFWRTNSYTLTNVRVVADVTDVSAARSTLRFTATPEQVAYLERAQLSFVPVCRREGRLAIYLSGSELFIGEPDCGVINTLAITPERLQMGENTITFETDGDLIIDQGAVRMTGKRFENRIFRFNFAPPQPPRPAVLRMMFADAGTKSGTIILNGNTIPFRAQDTYALQITQYIRPGENVLQFESAEGDFELVRFDVLLG
jgi:hypothetical protein